METVSTLPGFADCQCRLVRGDCQYTAWVCRLSVQAGPWRLSVHCLGLQIVSAGWSVETVSTLPGFADCQYSAWVCRLSVHCLGCRLSVQAGCVALFEARLADRAVSLTTEKKGPQLGDPLTGSKMKTTLSGCCLLHRDREWKQRTLTALQSA